MNTEQMLAEIRDANLSYLTLAQNLVKMDMADAVDSLGISEESAGLLSALSTEQLSKLATGSTLLCRFRMDDDAVFGLLTDHGLASRFGGAFAAARELQAA
ncbi:flagellar transcriptional regulator FlhD [Xylophilus sp. GOD-11R]|uniref:flagellar transcriptional regulator FlhD n=1 Tax=Xylophilus sp. GOD-11R TaxID=3089814 RepID=UPI00298C6789|nr:flagellar transcriptional regulator FlhD [Xylophilus sp. GOD-11R]WPB55559.1 flagellar transcriptional regulator FlhD [Xylophilus sp. GOD-11R]